MRFKNTNDFSLVEQFKENDDGSIQWYYQNSNGFIKSGMTTTWSEQTGTEQVSTSFIDVEIGVDEETGEPIFEQQEQFEEQPVFTEMSFSVYDELLAAAGRGEVVIEPYTISKEEQRQRLKQARDAALAAMVHDYGDGRVVQVRKGDLAEFQIEIANGVTRDWIAADNTIIQLTVAEMAEALNSGIGQGRAIYDTYMVALNALNSEE